MKLSRGISEVWQPDRSTCWSFLCYTFNLLLRKPSLHWFPEQKKKNLSGLVFTINTMLVQTQPWWLWEMIQSCIAVFVWGDDSLRQTVFKMESSEDWTMSSPDTETTLSPSARLSLFCEWCATEAKPRVRAKIYLTTTSLIGLQPEDHNFASGSCGTKTTHGDCRGLDIQQAVLSGQNRPRLLPESQFTRWRTDPWRLYHCKWQGTIIFVAV